MHVWGDESIKKYAPKRDHDGANAFSETRGIEPARAGFQTELKQGRFCQRCNAWLGSFGLEPTIELYIEHTVEIFRGVWKVLRKDGTVWLNLGSSMMGSGGAHKEHHKNPGISKSFERDGVPHGVTYGTIGKPPRSCQDDDCSLKNQYGEDPLRSLSHTFDIDYDLFAESVSCGACPIQVHNPRHCSYLDKHHKQTERSYPAKPDQQRFYCPAGGLLLSFPGSKIDEFFQQFQGVYSQISNGVFCPLRQGLVSLGFPESEHKKVFPSLPRTFFYEKPDQPSHTSCNEGIDGASDFHTKDKVSDSFACDSPSGLISHNLSTMFHDVKFKPKDLIPIPWMVAMALQQDGWYLRQDIIWSKPNPMPESVTDRCTKSHEYIFLLTKSAKYFYDAEAIKEPQEEYERNRRLREKSQGLNSTYSIAAEGKTGQSPQSGTGAVKNVQRRHELAEAGTRNKRSVWNVATHPFPEAHFATFPPKLIEPCILAGTSEGGCCAICGEPWRRAVEKEFVPQPDIKNPKKLIRDPSALDASSSWGGSKRGSNDTKTTGWIRPCKCDSYHEGPLPCVILDPFGGSMTTAIVAYKHGRKFVMIELSETYIKDIGIPRIEKETKQLKLWN